MEQATADAIRLINEADPGKGVLTIRALENMQKVADGKATKLIIPSDMQNLAGLVTSVKEMLTDVPAEKK